MFDTSIFVAVLGIALICIALLISHFKKKEIERKNIILSIPKFSNIENIFNELSEDIKKVNMKRYIYITLNIIVITLLAILACILGLKLYNLYGESENMLKSIIIITIGFFILPISIGLIYTLFHIKAWEKYDYYRTNLINKFYPTIFPNLKYYPSFNDFVQDTYHTTESQKYYNDIKNYLDFFPICHRHILFHYCTAGCLNNNFTLFLKVTSDLKQFLIDFRNKYKIKIDISLGDKITFLFYPNDFIGDSYRASHPLNYNSIYYTCIATDFIEGLLNILKK